MIAFLTTLLATLPPAHSAGAAVTAALALPRARAEVLGLSAATPRDCVPAAWSTIRPVAASGAVALRFDGRDAAGDRCEGFAWATVSVRTAGLRLVRDVRAGERLSGAAEPAEVAVEAGHPPAPALPPGAAAARTLRAGAVIEDGDLRVGPAPGDPVTVAVRLGDLELTLTGKALPCARDRGASGCAAALLPGGRRIEGRWDGARIAVEAP